MDDDELFLHMILHTPCLEKALTKSCPTRYLWDVYFTVHYFANCSCFHYYAVGTCPMQTLFIASATSLLCHSAHVYSWCCTLFFTRWLLIREEITVWLCQQKEKCIHGEKVMMGNWGMATEGIFCTPDVASVWSAAVSFRRAVSQLVKNYMLKWW
jgi:hypothetical protein